MTWPWRHCLFWNIAMAATLQRARIAGYREGWNDCLDEFMLKYPPRKP